MRPNWVGASNAIRAGVLLVCGTLAVVAVLLFLAPRAAIDAGAERRSSPSPVAVAPTSTPSPTPAAVPPAPPPPAEAEPAPPPDPTCASDVLTCVNEARAANGIAPLAANPTLDGAAQSCADRMAASGQMTHSTDHPAGFSWWGENIAQGYGSAAAVFAGWMGSEGHRANILNPAYSQMGIGYAAGDWWCQQFGG